jgi:hypothetical protein
MKHAIYMWYIYPLGLYSSFAVVKEEGYCAFFQTCKFENWTTVLNILSELISKDLNTNNKHQWRNKEVINNIRLWDILQLRLFRIK